MIERLYVNNYRCLVNFELITKEMPTALLIGANGTGKSSIRFALQTLQAIARGVNRMRDLRQRDLLQPEDFSFGNAETPLRIEIEAVIAGRGYKYSVAFDYPRGFKELRVYDESLTAESRIVFSRTQAAVRIPGSDGRSEAEFQVDWHLAALPIIQVRSEPDDLGIFKDWLARMVILAPVPGRMSGDSADLTLEPQVESENLGEWFSGLLGSYPAAYSRIEQYLHSVMPDFGDIQQVAVGPNVKRMNLSFRLENATMRIPFKHLSDGEKCFLLAGVVLAANQVSGPLFCFWDEPDNFLSLSEVGHFIMELRRAFGTGGQLLVTSHNPEAIRKFADENTLLLYRNSHLEPTLVRRLVELRVHGDLVEALIRGDVGP